MKNRLLCTTILAFVLTAVSSQKHDDYIWYDPLESINRLEGQGWENMVYHRLPDKAEKTVRNKVWGLSKHTAGLGVRFETDADSISVRYQVDGNLAMNHMPATGVSGVDMYVKAKGTWLWVRGRRKFDDIIQYDFALDALSHAMHEHQLLLPLYNAVKNLKIGVQKGSSFKILPVRLEKPIVVYGTSIAQGACASRPGMAWTNILARRLDYPVVNLGFSGNGRLEPEVIDLINEIDASVYVLDCLPNLRPGEENTKEEIQKRIRNSILSLREKHSKTPIVLVQHMGYSDGIMESKRASVYKTLNLWVEETYMTLQNKGVLNLYMLTKEELNLSNDAFVDGTHPTDLGMEQYAKAYEKKIKDIGISNK
ncbi:SGNH/GDSL hydrolase family protein [Ulvibacterium sp.]|uniref:SGNH/GDSL hydrolase family protein n=1 Tax=Ulvibacterium sp. TaxID=2665914 RepID=UPI003CC646D0